MSENALIDLHLSGVMWELTDIPIAAPHDKVVSTPVENNPVSAVSVVSEIGRCTASVVPAIAPTVRISLDTVRAMASRPNDMLVLNRMISEFDHPLRSVASNVVLPHIGNGRLMVLTDIPGSDDDATGRVLSGAAGELMDKMLSAIGQSRETVSILPMVFWRTPGGRTPSREELDLSRPFIDKAIELLSPRVILTLGTLPAAEIAGLNLTKSHGTAVPHNSGATVVPIFHPNYLILKPAAKREVWTALQNVENILKSAE